MHALIRRLLLQGANRKGRQEDLDEVCHGTAVAACGGIQGFLTMPLRLWLPMAGPCSAVTSTRGAGGFSRDLPHPPVDVWKVRGIGFKQQHRVLECICVLQFRHHAVSRTLCPTAEVYECGNCRECEFCLIDGSIL